MNPAPAAAVRAAAVPQRTLQDFEPLLLAELVVLRAAQDGSIARVRLRRPEVASADVRLRAAFLAFLAQGGGPGARVNGRRLQIVGAFVVGRLDLAFMDVPLSLWFYRCAFSSTPMFDGARFTGSLSFPGCALPGLRLRAARVAGDVVLNAGCEISGDVILTHAKVGRDLNCERLLLRRTEGVDGVDGLTLRADSAQITGQVLLSSNFESEGEVRFVGAFVGGDMVATGARMIGALDESGGRGVALNLDQTQIRGSLWLDGAFAAAGQVRLRQARIEGDLHADSAAFDAVGDASWGTDPAALQMDRAAIGGALELRRLQVPLQAASLTDARVGTLVDDASSWGLSHRLDGFSYRRFGHETPTDPDLRLEWLGRQFAPHLSHDFRPDPWRRLIRVLRGMGRHASARAVVVGRERHLRQAGLIGQDLAPPLRPLARLGHDLYGLCTGYGQRPARLLAAAAAVWLLCGALFWGAEQAGGVAPAAAYLLNNPRLAQCDTHCPDLPATTPAFQPWVYSAEALLPMVDLQQQRHWAPRRGAILPALESVLGTTPLRLLSGLEGLLGWAMALALVAMALNLTDRDRQV